ncbi:MAG: T9SS type A sorting domain-containing protein [Ignavibacteriae bacterium]|nr:T9SS type A sorting domain-containing protein [Ignavibacteriota bacterium]
MSNVYYEMNNVYMHGCDTMWGFINLNGNCEIDFTDCIISDAQYAIYSWELNYPKIILTNDTFRNNDFGICTFQSIPSYELSGNLFTGSLQGMLYPYIGLKSMVGISTYWNSSLNLNFIDWPNKFTLMKEGIVVHNTNMYIYSDFGYFDNIQGNFGYGNAIHSVHVSGGNQNMLLKEGNSGLLLAPDFNDCSVGIFAQNINVKAVDNNFIDVITGIKIDRCKNKTVLIDHNIIDCSYEGVFLYQNDPVGIIDVTNNIIFLNPSSNMLFGSACIKNAEALVPPSNYNNISFNELTVNSMGNYGIISTMAYGTLISDNAVKMNDYLDNVAGIKLNACRYNEVKCNRIYGPGYLLGNSAVRSPFGIEIAFTTETRYSCNETNETYTGIGFEDDCSGTDFRGNKMRNHSRGLWYNRYATTGYQSYKGNKWLGTSIPNYPDTAAVHDGFFAADQYYIGPCQNCLPPSIKPMANWFFNFTTGNDFECELMVPACADYGHEEKKCRYSDTILNGADYLIAADSINYIAYNDELYWSQDRYLFDKLNSNPGLLTGNPLMQSFYSLSLNNSVGQFQAVENHTKSAMTADETTAQYISDLSRRTFVIIDSIETINTILSTALNYADSVKYNEIIVALKLNLNILSQIINEATLGLEYLRSLLVEDLVSENNGLSSTTLIEANEKAVRDLYLKTVAVGNNNFTQIQLEIIRNIALQCPLSGGKAVYFARSLYCSIRDTIINENGLCMPQSIIKSKQITPENETEIHFSFYPNPALNSVQLFWNHSVEQFAEVQVFDLLGRKVHTQVIDLSGTIGMINITSLINGIYFLKIRTECGNSINCGKLVVTR